MTAVLACVSLLLILLANIPSVLLSYIPTIPEHPDGAVFRLGESWVPVGQFRHPLNYVWRDGKSKYEPDEYKVDISWSHEALQSGESDGWRHHYLLTSRNEALKGYQFAWNEKTDAIYSLVKADGDVTVYPWTPEIMKASVPAEKTVAGRFIFQATLMEHHRLFKKYNGTLGIQKTNRLLPQTNHHDLIDSFAYNPVLELKSTDQEHHTTLGDGERVYVVWSSKSPIGDFHVVRKSGGWVGNGAMTITEWRWRRCELKETTANDEPRGDEVV